MLNVGDILKLDIKKLGINGEGIAYYNRLAIFINGAIPGERVEAEITEVREKMAFAKVNDVIQTSSSRIEPRCKYFGRCGGCSVMHIDYQKMCALKRDAVIEALERYTDLNTRSFEIKPTVAMSNPYGYRFKLQLPVRDFSGKATVGLYSLDGKDVIYIDSCMNQADDVNRINKEILKLVDEINVVPYIEKYKRGELKHIVVRVSHSTKEAQVTLVTFSKTPKIFELAKRIMDIRGVVSVYESFNDSTHDGEIFGESIKLLEGKPTIVETIGKYRFQLLPNAFFQLNPVQTEKLYEHVLKAAKLSFKETVLDAFCGVGTIGLYLSHNSKEVIGIEYNKEAVENATANAKLNKVNNARFICGDVCDELEKLNDIHFDVVVCDPPRTGLGPDLCEAFLNTGAKRIIYVSCNPATLAKDLNILTKKYNVSFVEPIDMFPNTSHVETICVLTKKMA